jgi:hypothetical protein
MKQTRVRLSLILMLFSLEVFGGTIQRSAPAFLSDSLYSFFEKQNITVEKQLLTNTNSELFPYNLLVSLSENTKIEQETSDKQSVIILIPQEDVISHINSFIDFIQNSPSVSNINISCILTANDKTKKTDGSRTALESISNKEHISVIILESIQIPEPPGYDTDLIFVPGSQGAIAPRYIFEAVNKGLKESPQSYKIRGHFLSLYRLGLISSTPILSTWQKGEVDSCSIIVQNNAFKNISEWLNPVLINFDKTNLHNTDTYYSYFSFFPSLFITEKAYTILLIIVTLVTLFIIFGFSFVIGEKSAIYKKQFTKTWFLIPLILFFTCLFLYFGQSLTQFFFPFYEKAPVSAFILKIAFAFLFLALFSFLQYLFKMPLTQFIYGYLLGIIAFLNIYIFSAIDISLLLLFVFEYVLIYLTRPAKRIVPLFFSFILIVLPYVPLLYDVWTLGTMNIVENFFMTSFFGNLLISCILLPFQIMFIRVLVKFELWGKRHSVSIQKILIQAVIIIFLIAFISIGSYFISNRVENIESKDADFLRNNAGSSISLSTDRKILFGRSVNQIQISSKLPVLNYHITITSESTLPIYEANYPYDILSTPFIAEFNLSDYPPEPFILEFTKDDKTSALVEITAQIEYGSQLVTETTSYTVLGPSNE